MVAQLVKLLALCGTGSVIIMSTKARHVICNTITILERRTRPENTVCYLYSCSPICAIVHH
jgi:hypothetical protein